jgi:hypothetical protein
VLLALPFLGGCVFDPPVDRIAVKKYKAPRKDVAAVAKAAPPSAAPVTAPVAAAPVPAQPMAPAAAQSVEKVSVKPKLKLIKVKNCDCPEDFDASVCGDRRAYTTWSKNCASQQGQEIPGLQKTGN